MNIENISIKNFKKFSGNKSSFEFTDEEGNVSDITLIVGENGSGKSSILQAIVLVTATAVRDGFDPEKLEWPGFEFRHIHSGF